ncbi:raffinose/stachyose/melibiose transport system substrate-binding protein [Paenibacillus sp. V4I9]|uniref:ABC transporter substrate-binding protein n=1 Tax=Paenibacillus sp. V4I9 TaxID=3042308 RepID=UPI00277D442E|nr:ABC transporter substrate-binding protein [Paenibacillus sp. V4I9]MDQ0887000.1 raffinose/stachyose/melibiose transport system substrate-binding protein [Paenibacillus sp. V4I9]
MTKRWVSPILATMLTMSVILSGCGAASDSASTSASKESEKPKQEAKSDKVTIKMAMWDVNASFIDFLTAKVKEYSKVESNVNVEVEAFKSDGDYLKAMKVRLSANEMPDFFELKPNFINDFKSELLPLDDLSTTAKNKYAKKYAVDGKVLAMPTVQFPEMVYYHPSIFKELGLTVPTTWSQFLDVLNKIKENKKYIPYAMGGKDSWPDYPFNEFMHHLTSGDESYLSNLATQEHPFSEGTPFYKAYSKIETLYNAKVMGPDPLGVSWDQATGLFESKKAVVVAAGLWYLDTYLSKVGNTDDLAAFPMPVRDSETDPLTVMTFTDHFYAINKNSKHTDAVKKFMEWFYSPAVHQEYVDKVKLGAVIDGVTANVPFLNDFYKNNKITPFLYVPGNQKYTDLINATQLDWKNIGQDMMSGKKLSDISKQLEDKWGKAREAKK